MSNVRYYKSLRDDERSKLRDDLQILIAEKNWEGCAGLDITDEMKVTIAAQIAILTLGYQQQYFERVLSILVYPDTYVAAEQNVTQGRVILEGHSAREGEAWYRGPVILSWTEVLAGGRGNNRSHNVVFHEFAHQLDMLNGRSADGVPAMESNAQASRWVRTLDREYAQLSHDCQHGMPTILDCYGATNKAEFFAVATEAFFNRPRELKRHHAELFTNLCEYYRQIPIRIDSH